MMLCTFLAFSATTSVTMSSESARSSLSNTYAKKFNLFCATIGVLTTASLATALDVDDKNIDLSAKNLDKACAVRDCIRKCEIQIEAIVHSKPVTVERLKQVCAFSCQE